MISRLADSESSTWSRPGSSEVSEPSQRPFIRASDVQGAVQPVENLILRYPAAALASAFIVGVLVAWWIKRK